MAASAQQPVPAYLPVEPAPQPAAIAPQPADPMPQPSVPVSGLVGAQEDEPDFSTYDQTIVLPDYSEDDLDTIVQPDLWEGYSDSVASAGAPVAPEPANPSPLPMRSADPHQADDSETMVLVPEMVQQPIPAPPVSVDRALQLTRMNGDLCVLTTFPVTIGKGSEADLIIGDNSAVSRVHVRVLRDGDMFAVEDLGSTNKTYIDDYELPPYTPTILSDGSTLKLANEVLRVALR